MPSFDSAFFTWADLRRSNFQGVDMTNAIFTEADMRECRLSKAKLDRASLSRVDLRGSYLGGASLVGALLGGADLRNCEGLTPGQLAGAWIDESTHFPPQLATDEWVLARLAACASGSSRPVPPPTPLPS
ncbi:pentapeptide repeat-containing protein [Streptomyces mirabilis]|uniref:pentapeptide repeat-containing protein n=1 Tax=Streptomyces mirabilis TaxID=68239 RepID=UPI00368E4DC5